MVMGGKHKLIIVAASVLVILLGIFAIRYGRSGSTREYGPHPDRELWTVIQFLRMSAEKANGVLVYDSHGGQAALESLGLPPEATMEMRYLNHSNLSLYVFPSNTIVLVHTKRPPGTRHVGLMVALLSGEVYYTEVSNAVLGTTLSASYLGQDWNKSRGYGRVRDAIPP